LELGLSVTPARVSHIAILRVRPSLAMPRLAFERFAYVISILAVAGALVAAGQVTLWSSMGAWPFHDTANVWLAGRHLLEGKPVYDGLLGGLLVFVYSPPIAILAAPLSLFPVEVLAAGLLVAQILALRWIAGSWKVAGIVAWLPFVPRELVTGNTDLLMAAAIYASVRGLRGSGYAAALFAFVKFSPALAVTRWREAALAALVLLALTLPWLSLWPEWVRTMIASLQVHSDTIAIVWRVPFVLALLALRRPWSIAAAAALATPAFYFHSWILLLPALRLLYAERSVGRQAGDPEVAPTPRPAAGTDGQLAATPVSRVARAPSS
jgi:hypothetical protein